MGFIRDLTMELAGEIESYLNGRVTLDDLRRWTEVHCASLPEELDTALLNEAVRTITDGAARTGEESRLFQRQLHTLDECLRGRRPFCLWLNVKRDLTFLPGRTEKEVLELLDEFLREENPRHHLDCEKILNGLDYSQPESLLCQEAVFGMASLLNPERVQIGDSFFFAGMPSSQADCAFGGRASLTAGTAEARLMLMDRLRMIKNALSGVLSYAVFLRHAEDKISASLAFFGTNDREEALYRTMKNRYTSDATQL
jgi:hypothetical protein